MRAKLVGKAVSCTPIGLRFFEPLFERIASIGVVSARGSTGEDECHTHVGSKRPSVVVVQDEHTATGEHTPAATPGMLWICMHEKWQHIFIAAAPTPKPAPVATKITLSKKQTKSNKKATQSPADAARANYDHYMSTGQPLAAGNWRGCLKSSECDREARHRGICNHKCIVPAPPGVCTDPPSPREGPVPTKRPRLASTGVRTASRAEATSHAGTTADNDSDGDTMTPGTSHTNAMASWREDGVVDMPAAEDEVSNHSQADVTVSVSLDEPFACFPTIREAWPQHRARLEALGLQHGVDHKSHLRKRFPSLASGFDPNDAGAVGQRQCTACSKQVTPVWRAGPTGPKSLCNACGVRHLKNFKRK